MGALRVSGQQQNEQRQQLEIEPQSEMQRDVQQLLEELRESREQLARVEKSLYRVASEYERLLNDLRDRS